MREPLNLYMFFNANGKKKVFEEQTCIWFNKNAKRICI